MAHGKVTVFLFLLILLGIRCQEDVRKPPIIVNPIEASNSYYTPNSNVVVNCTANGQPQPTYKWLLGGVVISPSSLSSYDATTGALIIPSFTTREEGTYQCMASNVFTNGQGAQYIAASLSEPQTLLQSRVNRFDSSIPVTTQVTEYDYLRLRCGSNSTTAVGKIIKINWYDIGRNGISMDGYRLFIDIFGDLHFRYVLQKDVSFSYQCGISVDSESFIQLGTINYLVVTSKTPNTAVKPQFQYSNSGIQVPMYQDAKLQCDFSGYDLSQSNPNNPFITWRDDAGSITNTTNYTISYDGRELIVRNVGENSERQYYCNCKNSAGEASNSVFLNVTSKPMFDPGAPSDQTVPENTNVQFNCYTRSAAGESLPGPPDWFINGVKLGPQNDPNKFQLSNSNTILNILNVQKATDILCVQCQVSNSVGTTMANACLNVILPITITKQPSLYQEITYGKMLDFTIAATTDPSMILYANWVVNNVTYVLNDCPPHMVCNPSTGQASINTSSLTPEQYDQIGGLYRKMFYNQFEIKNVDIMVVLLDRQAASQAGVGVDPWIIGLIIALILLLIVILIIVYVICRKKQEGDYNVDKKETGAGLDPEKELKDKDFNAFSRPAYDEYYNYPDTKPPGGDPEYDDAPMGDDESLGEYGKEDITHFNEDGSFIGMYQSKQPPPRPPSESTI